jgi:hypothetical protein
LLWDPTVLNEDVFLWWLFSNGDGVSRELVNDLGVSGSKFVREIGMERRI